MLGSQAAVHMLSTVWSRSSRGINLSLKRATPAWPWGFYPVFGTNPASEHPTVLIAPQYPLPPPFSHGYSWQVCCRHLSLREFNSASNHLIINLANSWSLPQTPRNQLVLFHYTFSDNPWESLELFFSLYLLQSWTPGVYASIILLMAHQLVWWKANLCCCLH